MTPLSLSNGAARRLFLDRHALSETPQGPAKGADLLDLITRLGFVQLDSINTVARAHDLILFARRPRYRPVDLNRLYERDRALFEHWTHDASVIPVRFYPYWHLRRKRDAEALRARWSEQRRAGFEEKFQDVIRHIRDNGPCCSADVGTDEARGSGGWWDWHPSKTALEYLWRSGALAVTSRRGFRKYYDLTERVLDRTQIGNAPDTEETIDWCCRAALARLGFATPRELAQFWAHITLDEAKAWCMQALAAGRIIEVQITAADGQRRPAFAFPEIEGDPALSTDPTPRLRVLSPFDPALRDRTRAQRLFSFDYRIEIFVPEAKRQYGYYVFPILQGNRMVGRVDMKAYRDEAVLRVRALWPEPGVRWGKGRRAAFEGELDRVRRLAGVAQVVFDPGWLR